MLLNKLRERAQSEKGFTLIELLVVILIIGILAAIAIPAFLGQREKAMDAGAKTQARNAASAMEAYYTDEQSYGAATLADAKKIEPSLNTENVAVTVAGNGQAGYAITAKHNTTNHTFTLTKTITPGASGAPTTVTVARTCDSPGNGGCSSTSKW